MTKEELKEHLLNTLPPVLCRQGVEKYTGGLIKAQTMRRMDCQGTGPLEGRFKRNRKVFYTREPFVDWFIEESSPLV
ncbi:hypothetical protein [Desulfovibrio gilichinskyi]|uniref:Uncharacterized protein n=1 Tax=Desulfovibrio gilichinskyi TaxID=1519643 RepID=A0A1X7F1M5_9BACT|nr:hypothetical protein [Desulfovibrio gilichinskyi]SMF44044.1 hypothetical protein SAMN06295933_3565 [Desulfovibrio gilichinskyi]